MSKFLHSSAAAVITALVVSNLAGCGHMVNVPRAVSAASVPGFTAGMETEATSTLMQGFDSIHKAVFTLLDKDKNGQIDEYEAGPNLSLADFQRADTDHDGDLSYGEFKKYAITNLFFFHDSAANFTKRFRSALGEVFRRLDRNGDGVLTRQECSGNAFKKMKLTFQYPRLNIVVKFKKVDDNDFKASDKTGDGKLGQAEFEDFYINAVVKALGGAPDGDDPTDPPSGNDPAPLDPNADPGAPPPPGGDVPAPPAPEPVPQPKGKGKK